MRDLQASELGFVYGAGGSSKSCKPVVVKCKGGSSKGGSHSKGKGSKSKGKCGS